MQGKVVNVIDKATISVEVEEKIKHPLYQKVIKRVKKFLVHIPTGMDIPKKDDMVEVFASKPISKKKKWTLK